MKMKYMVPLEKIVQRLQGRQLFCRVSTESTEGGPDVVIRIGYTEEATAERVAQELTAGDEMSDMRIALEVRLYEDVLYQLHWAFRQPNNDHLRGLIRRFEANAYEVTWKRPVSVRRPIETRGWYD